MTIPLPQSCRNHCSCHVRGIAPARCTYRRGPQDTNSVPRWQGRGRIRSGSLRPGRRPPAPVPRGRTGCPPARSAAIRLGRRPCFRDGAACAADDDGVAGGDGVRHAILRDGDRAAKTAPAPPLGRACAPGLAPPGCCRCRMTLTCVAPRLGVATAVGVAAGRCNIPQFVTANNAHDPLPRRAVWTTLAAADTVTTVYLEGKASCPYRQGECR